MFPDAPKPVLYEWVVPLLGKPMAATWDPCDIDAHFGRLTNSIKTAVFQRLQGLLLEMQCCSMP